MYLKLFFLIGTCAIINVHSQHTHPLFRPPKQPQQPSATAQPNQQSPPSQPQQQFGHSQPQHPQFSFSQPSSPQQPQFQIPPQQQPPLQSQFFDPNQQFGQQFGPQQPQFAPQPQQQFFPQPPPQRPLQAQAQPPLAPQINWGKCPQLEPSDKEKTAKAGVITKCLETTPLPSNITRQTVELHREQIAACALQSEGWFNRDGGYDFGKAESEIKNKNLQKEIETQVLSYHKQCKSEAEQKFPAKQKHVIGQIQLYQACMDYFISDVCGIEVNEPETSGPQGPQFGSFQ